MWRKRRMVWYSVVNVDLYSAIITKVSVALNTLVSREKPGFQALSKGHRQTTQPPQNVPPSDPHLSARDARIVSPQQGTMEACETSHCPHGG